MFAKGLYTKTECLKANTGCASFARNLTEMITDSQHQPFLWGFRQTKDNDWGGTSEALPTAARGSCILRAKPRVSERLQHVT